MLRTCRAAVAVLVVGELALIVSPQARDMLEFLDVDRLGAAVSFQIALAVLGISAWFWSRAVLAARFDIDDDVRTAPSASHFDWTAFVWLPRLTLVAAFLGGATMAYEGRSAGSAVGALPLGALALLLTVRRPRHALGGAPPPPRGDFLNWCRRDACLRFCALLRHAPYGIVPSSILLVLGLVPLAFGSIEAFVPGLRLPNTFAAVFPGPGIAVLLLGLMIGPLIAATFVLDGLTLSFGRGQRVIGLRRPPTLAFILIYVFVFVPNVFPVHTVKIIDGPRIAARPLDEIFVDWMRVCAPGKGSIRPVVVAVSGGATRAGLWGLAVLDQVLRAQTDKGGKLFAVSSVSGGSLGTAGAMSLLSQRDVPCRTDGLEMLRPPASGPVPLAGDALGPLLGGWLLDDIPRTAFEPFADRFRLLAKRRPNGGDSAEAIESGFADLWAASSASPGHRPLWDEPFLSLFYTGSASYRPGMPLWFANGTDAPTGNRIITSPILAPTNDDGSRPWPFRGARDFHSLMRADVSITTAINNTARFPYLEPFGEMLQADTGARVGSLVDGGYFENEGLETALELAAWLTSQAPDGRPVEPIIVEATGDGESDISTPDVMTCDTASDAPFIADHRSAWQILAPLIGLYHVRGGHSAALLRLAHDLCQVRKLRFIHFYLPANDGEPVPLNWVLSDRMARFIWSAVLLHSPVDNAEQLRQLKAALADE
ncbi:MAG TPA: hypothetical protein VKS60_07425 [Stellaceae bacterium]|nr:hypothetical protein [Stellaceae bacterium]